MVRPEGQFKTRFREALRPREPGIVNEQMQRQITREKRLRALSDRSEITEVEREYFHVRVTRRLANFIDGRLCLFNGTTRDKDVGTARGQLACSHEADARVRTCNQCDAPTQGFRVSWFHSRELSDIWRVCKGISEAKITSPPTCRLQAFF